eukprot:TRINITY_DN5249_c0_g1_i1.p1 TRINITY_DN5249_c0_g1~~TRINITY_DN5249_c0_g1_i1.p1  ORF type:complete len:158 (-),score=52.87 TRINITY_DN5249_c0_g1_i1:65-538(-)
MCIRDRIRTQCSTATDDEILLEAAQAQARAKSLRLLRRITRKQMQSERRALIIAQRKMDHFLSRTETPEEHEERVQRDQDAIEELRWNQALHLKQLESEGTFEAFLADKNSSPQKLKKEEEKSAKQRRTSKTEEYSCLLYTSPSPRDRTRSRMPSSA